MTNKPITAQSFDAIQYTLLCSRKAALRLEILGMKRRGRSCYSICKSEYGLKGNRKKVLAALEAMVLKVQNEHGVSQ